ncbi:MAG TPA: ATP-dependent DNA helicase RecG [Candidatus Polarisedimenticolia bacterium]|nr:ATP-dependent DNA helicase RecG [Candidatus Polarisedimenticolia bacterium]
MPRMPSLHDPVRFMSGVGPEMARRLGRLDIHTIRDLLYHVPRAYRDRRLVTPVAFLKPNTEATVLGTLKAVRSDRRFRGRRDVSASVWDETGDLRIVWFNQPFVEKSLEVGRRYYFSGPVEVFRGLEMHNPEFLPEDAGEAAVARVTPVYGLTQGVAQRWLRARIEEAVRALPGIFDPVPEAWRRGHGLPSLRQALERVHFPERPEDAEPARRRLALEELLRVQISLLYARAQHRRKRAARSLQRGAEDAARFREGLPFTLTRAQSEALEAIERDLDREEPMARLLLGDVGSGKTVIALAAAVRAAGAGAQTAILAPTSILAEQHAATASRLLPALGVPYALLTAATGAKDRARILDGLRTGSIMLVIGTHALLERDLHFHALGLVVVDEQHRFGVRQRISLASKSEGMEGAHLLVLTATPIPRTLAMALYGDLDLSILNERPPGRAPIRTEVLPEDTLTRVLHEEVEQGGSAFVVYPVVEESEETDLKSAVAMAKELSGIEALATAGVALVHGRLKVEERRRAIERFRSGEARILVATTVVEVGLDIPDATLIVIEHPERFGLAQLHQLRGRVGRADRPGRCVLLQRSGTGELARKRLEIFRRVENGQELAEEDLKIRGPGELLGTSQHGFPEFRAVNPVADLDLIEAARGLAQELIAGEEAKGGGAALQSWIDTHFQGADQYLQSG